MSEAIELIEKEPEKLSYCLFSPDWHLGVLGIVAGKLVDKYKKPCFVLTRLEDGLIKGSGRSIEGFPLDEAMVNMRNLLVEYGGHKLACGVTLLEKNLEKFSEGLERIAKKILSNNQFCQIYNIDSYLEVEEIDNVFFEQLDMLEPFGMGNPEPIFLMDNVEVINFRYVGSKENHLKLFLKKNNLSFSAIGFYLGNDGISVNSKLDLIGVPKKTEYNGQKKWDFYVKDYDLK